MDILINNAGILRDKNMLRITENDWNDIIEIHLSAPFKLTQAVFPLMKKNKYGKIVTTSRYKLKLHVSFPTPKPVPNYLIEKCLASQKISLFLNR